MGETEPAIVTTKHPDGTVEELECAPDDYVLVLGPYRYVAHVQNYPRSGTTVVTIKMDRPAEIPADPWE